MEQLTKNQAVATSQEAVQNQNEPQLRDENAHNDKSVHGVLNPTYQAGLRRDAVQPDIEAERKKRDEIEAGKSYCSRRFGGATCDDKSAQIYARFDKNDWRIQPAEFYRSEERFSRNAETDLVCRLLLEKKKLAAARPGRDQCRPRFSIRHRPTRREYRGRSFGQGSGRAVPLRASEHPGLDRLRAGPRLPRAPAGGWRAREPGRSRGDQLGPGAAGRGATRGDREGGRLLAVRVGSVGGRREPAHARHRARLSCAPGRDRRALRQAVPWC